MKPKEFYEEYFGEKFPEKRFELGPEDLILAMSEYAQDCLLDFYIPTEIQADIDFLYDNPDEDRYINSNLEHFMNNGEPDDNSMELAGEWEEALHNVFDWLKWLINYDED